MTPSLGFPTFSALLRSTARFAAAARAAGSNAELTVRRGAPHVFQSVHAFVPEARRALDETIAFLDLAREGAGK